MPRGETSNVADGLENVVAAETVLSKVDGEAGVLILRGHHLQDIAGRRSFEWLTGVLWQDFVASSARPRMRCAATWAWRGNALSRRCATLLPIAARLPPLSAVRQLLASVPDDADDAPLLLTATVAVGLAAVIRIRDGGAPVAPDPHAGHAADFLRMLRGVAADAGRGGRAGHLPGERRRSWAERVDLHRARGGVHQGEPDRRGDRGACAR